MKRRRKPKTVYLCGGWFDGRTFDVDVVSNHISQSCDEVGKTFIYQLSHRDRKGRFVYLAAGTLQTKFPVPKPTSDGWPDVDEVH